MDKPENASVDLRARIATSSPRKSGYLPGLDGWRALAVLAVLFTHDTPWSIAGHSDEPLRSYGLWGVTLFFAISGILICSRILDDEKTTGAVDLRAFYLRRLFRIQPAALCYIATIALLTSFGILHESGRSFLGALFFYTNFLYHATDHSGTMVFLGHFWTLAVEEHFYILLSLLLFVFRKRRIAIFTVLIACIWYAQRLGNHHGYFSPDVSIRRTGWVIQLLLLPALFALLLRVKMMRRTAERFLQPWTAFLATLCLVLLHKRVVDPTNAIKGPQNIINTEAHVIFLCFSLWVIATMLHPRSLTTRILELKPIRLLGRISYSVYLWHVLFFVPSYPEYHIPSPALHILAERPWKYLAILAAASLSYYLVEKPLIRLGHRLAPPVTPGHADLRPEVNILIPELTTSSP